MSTNMFDVSSVYKVHNAEIAWSEEKRNGVTAGSEGSNLQMEAFILKLEVPEGIDLKARYRVLESNVGWTEFVNEGEIAGTVGEARQLEAIAIELTGFDADKYDVFYQVHVSGTGWMNWMKNGDQAGTEGFALQAEGIRIIVFKKGVELRTDGVHGFVKYEAPPAVDPATDSSMAGKYFTWKELSCDCPDWKYGFGYCDGYPEQSLMEQNLPWLLDVLEKIRNYFGSPVIITSMIRCPDCNDHWGGIPGSYHTTWQAVDIVVPGHSAYEVAVVANDLTGCGARHYDIDCFTHIEPAGCGVYCQQAA